MWKRLSNTKGARQSHIRDPVLTETPLDENAYSNMASSPKSPVDMTAAPERPQRESKVKGLPGLPNEAISPPARRSLNSYQPPPSLHSQQQSPLPARPPKEYRESYHAIETAYPNEISPPSSPEAGTSTRPVNANANDDDVSPIDEVTDGSRLDFGERHARLGSRMKSPPSSIPVLRREKRNNQLTGATPSSVARKEVGANIRGRVTHDPRWDPYSGEITTSDRGKPQSVKPGQFTPPTLKDQRTGLALGNESKVTAGQKSPTSFGERIRKLKINNAPTEKPGWKGASGRATLVDQVADQPDILPLNMPRKSNNHVTSPPPPFSPSVPTARKAETDNAPSSDQADPTIKVVLSNSGQNSPRTDSPSIFNPDAVAAAPSGTVQTQAEVHLNSTGFPDPTSVQDPVAHLKESESTGTIERNFHEALRESFPNSANDPYMQPPSRFSISTYSTTEPRSTPRPSTDGFEPPQMPTPPQKRTPVLNRKRPKAPSESPKSQVSRKAISSSSPVFISMKASIASSQRPGSLLSISKDLPQSPAEASSHDLVTSLQAQLDNLQHRRRNITKSIRQMTELMPQDNLIVTAEVRLKREAEKRKVESLREQEADVRREEHEIGLRLHRAWKRRDKAAVYEPTGLWVQRIAS